MTTVLVECMRGFYDKIASEIGGEVVHGRFRVCFCTIVHPVVWYVNAHLQFCLESVRREFPKVGANVGKAVHHRLTAVL